MTINADGTWGRPERPDRRTHLDDLRRGRALLLCDLHRRAMGTNTDGFPILYSHRDFADLSDDWENAIEFCVLRQIPYTTNPDDRYDHVLLILTGGAHTPMVAKQIELAQRRKKPIFGLNLHTGQITRHQQMLDQARHKKP